MVRRKIKWDEEGREVQSRTGVGWSIYRSDQVRHHPKEVRTM